MLSLYQSILTPRLIEERMLLALRQGKLSKWFSGIGQEAISVGATLALDEDEWILPLHRNLGVFTCRNLPLQRLFSQWLGKATGYSHGRDRSFHFGSRDHHIVGMISHLGPQLCVANGIALAHRLRGQSKVTMVFSGEGGTSQGDFHEALNLASVWELPVLFVIENNGYALSTPTHQQYRCQQLVDRAQAYGMEGHQIDGNDLLLVHRTVQELTRSMREQPRPVLLECLTFRMRGHEEASGTDYVPDELALKWAEKDPVLQFERYLLREKLVQAEQCETIREKLKAKISADFEAALQEPAPAPNAERESRGVYRSFSQTSRENSPSGREIRYVDAIAEGLRLAMQRHFNMVFMGQDVAEYGGVFKISQGLLEEFGPERVRNTPLCESAIVGATLGLSVAGLKSIMEMQFADFASCAYNQIVNNLAKSHYRWGQNADVVIRFPSGGSLGAGPFHSQSLEATFAHVPGLKIVYPAFPDEAKGLLLAAVEDPNPVLYFEHKALYRRLKGPVPDGYYTTPLGVARQLRQGDQISIITYGLGVHWALEVLAAHPEIRATLLDLRTLLPLDVEAILQAVRASGKALVLHEDTLTGGIGGEVAALIAQHCFEYLDGPVIRCGSLDTPVPFAKELEQDFLARARFEQQLLELVAY
ncbi:MAG: dehydrogenase [Candidatus Eremiobacteraeota bacterium]|nr:dehydrogenase [Candidatus Eremiobacteraeota bacterium]MCW5867334.1 dehydrogenase [Candidatus Eremiobacteraeota bacterium]